MWQAAVRMEAATARAEPDIPAPAANHRAQEPPAPDARAVDFQVEPAAARVPARARLADGNGGQAMVRASHRVGGSFRGPSFYLHD
jgi:hypothetical protein